VLDANATAEDVLAGVDLTGQGIDVSGGVHLWQPPLVRKVKSERRREKMVSIAQEAHLPALDHHRREEVGRELQKTLVELVDLSLLGKQLHWNIFGRPFKPLHEHLDELVDSWRELSDTVAERAVALGVAPDGQSATVSAGSGLAAVARGGLDTDSALGELVPRLADVAERIRARMERLGELDLASQDVLVEVVRELEKQLWMLRASLPAGAA
jgi:starvation-inducible DNA-binding protein